MVRSYLQIPHAQKDEAKAYCRRFRLPSIVYEFNEHPRQGWYYPRAPVPPGMASLWPVIEVVDDGQPTIASNEPPNYQIHTGFVWTDEQKRIIATEPGGPDNVLIIRAGAGAAKTTTLEGYTAARPEKRFLYLAFGKANAVEAQKKFPPNTVCKTTHALAFRALSQELRSKLSDSFRADTIQQILGLDPNAQDTRFKCHLIFKVLQAFWASTESEPSSIHANSSIRNEIAAHDINTDSVEQLVKESARVWDKMRNPYDRSAPLTHEAYLKIYCDSNPDLSRDFDYIALDEAQDTNPIVEQLIFNQRIPKIIVGDPHQNIYVFRRAFDILSPRAARDNPCLYLTHSFRYGPEIAHIANLLLYHLKDETQQLVGRAPSAQVHPPGRVDWRLQSDGSYTEHAMLTRNNSTLFDAAVDAINQIDAYIAVNRNNPDAPPPPKIAFVGTNARERFSPFYAYKFNRLLDILCLHIGSNADRHRIQDPFIARFQSFEELEAFATAPQTADPDLAAACNLTRRYRGALRPLIYRITECCTNPNDPTVWIKFATAHKSKGLEFPRVLLTNDFYRLAKLYRGTFQWGSKPSPEEANLIYVAVTRAKSELCLNVSLALYLQGIRETSAMTGYIETREFEAIEPRRWEDHVNRLASTPEIAKALVEERKKQIADAIARKKAAADT